jgi:hypothetical protein
LDLQKQIGVGLVCLEMLAVAGCQSTMEDLQVTAKKQKPGDSAHSWVNSIWPGADDRYDMPYWMWIVDGNRIIGKEESCGRSSGACSGRVTLRGEAISKDTLDITYDKRDVPNVGRIFRQELVRSGDDVLFGPGLQLGR